LVAHRRPIALTSFSSPWLLGLWTVGQFTAGIALPCSPRVIRRTRSWPLLLSGSLGLVDKTPGQAADPPSILVHARGPRIALLFATPPCCTTPLRHIQPWVVSIRPRPSQDRRTRFFRCRCERIFLFTLRLQQARCAVAPSRLSASPQRPRRPAQITGSLCSVQPSVRFATGANLSWGVDAIATPQLPQCDFVVEIPGPSRLSPPSPLRPPKRVHGPCFRNLWLPFGLVRSPKLAVVCVGHPRFPLVALETRTGRRRHAQPQIHQSRHLQL